MRALTDRLFSTPAMDALWSAEGQAAAMLRFEAALAHAQARVGAIPADTAEAIAAACDPSRFDLPAIAEAAARSGNPAIPLVAALRADVARADGRAAAYVHWGATSQDAIDTAWSLRARDSVRVLGADLARMADALARLADAYRATPMAARTLFQHAVPTSFGMKAATWLAGLDRARLALARAAEEAALLQLGGAGGTLASLGAYGPAVAEALAAELDLGLPALPWHTARDCPAALGCALGVAIGVAGKIGRDLASLQSTEVAEAFEPAAPGRGGSSAMPGKRNPVAAIVAAAAATRAPGLVATLLTAMVGEHERAAGAWHAEWDVWTELFRLAAGSFAQLADVLDGLEVDPDAMRANLARSHGLIHAEAAALALTPTLGRAEAERIVAEASRRALESGTDLQAELAAAGHATDGPEADLQPVLDRWIDRAVAAHRGEGS